MYMNSQKQQLIPKRLFETYRQWVSENPYFEKTCEEMNVKANSYAQLFHIYAQRKGLLSKKETVNEIIKTSKQTKLTEMI